MDLVSLYPAIKSLWTVWLVLIFAILVLRALRPSRKQAFARAAAIPLRDDERRE
ncbi:MAG: cbb3-type cytochrome c oxidase subunit 3 [Alphaproteobacteria bacterium]|nr:cbb3-type cytochrome c oxidase subunit 3 [Alphaproteobacteria bacterium]